jgi:hypothetical protein
LIEPIDAAIRRISREAADAEWSGADARHLFATLTLLKQAREKGERWHVLF